MFGNVGDVKKKYETFIILLKANIDDRTWMFINSLPPVEAASLMFMAQRSPKTEESQLAGDFILRWHGHGDESVGCLQLWS